MILANLVAALKQRGDDLNVIAVEFSGQVYWECSTSLLIRESATPPCPHLALPGVIVADANARGMRCCDAHREQQQHKLRPMRCHFYVAVTCDAC